MHAATSAMFRGTSLPRHLRSRAESSGSVQNPLLRGRSSNHSEPSVDTSRGCTLGRITLADAD